MVCNRCIKVVRDELEKLNLKITNIKLGTVWLESALDNSQQCKVKEVLVENGFELIDDKKSKIVDRIKTIIIDKVHHNLEENSATINSENLAKELGYEYSYLSHLFSTSEGVTIEKYLINQKIERVKELLDYNELSLKEISYQMGYSSVQHLSNQFKRITGLSPTQFKNVKSYRKPLDKI